MKDFKGIADDMMRKIEVTDELKEKTLNRCIKKKHVPVYKYLAPVACLILIFGALKMSDILPSKLQTGEDRNIEITPMIGNDNETQILPGENNNNTSIEFNTVTKWQIKTLDDAKKRFGDSFIVPSHIPENFELDKIQGTGTEDLLANKIVLNYSSGDKLFLVIQEKTIMQLGFVDFKEIEINGTKGYLKPNLLENDKNIKNLDTELHWFKDGIHYSVMGLITEQEAIKIAESMK